VVNLEYINKQTAAAYQLLGNEAALSDFTLVGGTALALQAGHRNSLDLDFTLLTDADRLPTGKIKTLMTSLARAGHSATLIQDQAAASQFRINYGFDLSAVIMEYVLNGVKIQFFVKSSWPHDMKQQMRDTTLDDGNTSFTVLSTKGLCVAKTMVLADRVRSRDLFDLLWLLEENHLTIKSMASIVSNYDPAASFDDYTNKLIGIVPVDADDEGLDPVGVVVDVADINEALGDFVDEYETTTASEYTANNEPH